MSKLLKDIMSKRLTIDECYLVGTTFAEDLDNIGSESVCRLNSIYNRKGEITYNSRMVSNMKVGDLVVLKSSYTEIDPLGFDSDGRRVPVLKIYAIGTGILANLCEE